MNGSNIAPSIAAVCVAVQVAYAQPYPSKPIRIVTQYVPGSSGDNGLRFVTPFMSASMGQPVVIENRPGAGGVIAAETVMRSQPDGYSVLAGNSGTYVIRQFLVKDMPFDPARDFMPITQLPMAIGVLSGAAPLIASGKLKLLAVVGSKRNGKFPQTPALAEAVPGFESPSSWTGIFGPAALPMPLARRISSEFAKATNDPETKEKLINAGNEPVASTPEQFAEAITKEIALVRRIV